MTSRSKPHKWTPEELELLRTEYPTCDTKKLAQRLGLKFRQVQRKANVLGLRKIKGSQKKGYRTPTWKPLGNCFKDSQGNMLIKIHDTGKRGVDYVLLHHLVWELHRGPVPDKHQIAFRDGNKENIVIENLYAISFADRMRQNTYLNYPEELRELIHLKGQLTTRLKERDET